jgi:sulfate permease, SulP family
VGGHARSLTCFDHRVEGSRACGRGRGDRTCRGALGREWAGLFLLILIVVAGEVVATIPFAALVAVMNFVAAVTFNWHSVHPKTLRRVPVSETLNMVVTVATTIVTHDLAIGVGAGVVVAMVAFARSGAHLVDVTSVTDPEGPRSTR